MIRIWCPPRGVAVMAHRAVKKLRQRVADTVFCTHGTRPISGNKTTQAMLYDKYLDITEQDIENETDLQKLLDWKSNLEMDVINIKRSICNVKSNGKVRRANDAKSYKLMLIKSIDNKIRILKMCNKGGSKEVLLMRKFMKVAKEELTKEQYKTILEKAKEIINYQ